MKKKKPFSLLMGMLSMEASMENNKRTKERKNVASISKETGYLLISVVFPFYMGLYPLT